MKVKTMMIRLLVRGSIQIYKKKRLVGMNLAIVALKKNINIVVDHYNKNMNNNKIVTRVREINILLIFEFKIKLSI